MGLARFQIKAKAAPRIGIAVIKIEAQRDRHRFTPFARDLFNQFKFIQVIDVQSCPFGNGAS